MNRRAGRVMFSPTKAMNSGLMCSRRAACSRASSRIADGYPPSAGWKPFSSPTCWPRLSRTEMNRIARARFGTHAARSMTPAHRGGRPPRPGARNRSAADEPQRAPQAVPVRQAAADARDDAGQHACQLILDEHPSVPGAARTRRHLIPAQERLADVPRIIQKLLQPTPRHSPIGTTSSKRSISCDLVTGGSMDRSGTPLGRSAYSSGERRAGSGMPIMPPSR